MRDWLWNVLIGLDQLTNAVAGGEAGDTISGRTGRTGLGGVLDRFLDRLDRDHSTESLPYTPWGTVDPHNLRAVDAALARDWDLLVQVVGSPRDLDAFLPETLEGAERAARRLRVWVRDGGRARWAQRMGWDVDAGDALLLTVTV